MSVRRGRPLCSLQHTHAPTPSPPTDHAHTAPLSMAPLTTPAFEAWLAERGVSRGPVAVAAVPGAGRGVVATAPIVPGDVLVAVPQACLVCVPTARACPEYAAAEAAVGRALSPEQVCGCVGGRDGGAGGVGWGGG